MSQVNTQHAKPRLGVVAKVGPGDTSDSTLKHVHDLGLPTWPDLLREAQPWPKPPHYLPPGRNMASKCPRSANIILVHAFLTFTRDRSQSASIPEKYRRAARRCAQARSGLCARLQHPVYPHAHWVYPRGSE